MLNRRILPLALSALIAFQSTMATSHEVQNNQVVGALRDDGPLGEAPAPTCETDPMAVVSATHSIETRLSLFKFITEEQKIAALSDSRYSRVICNGSRAMKSRIESEAIPFDLRGIYGEQHQIPQVFMPTENVGNLDNYGIPEERRPIELPGFLTPSPKTEQTNRERIVELCKDPRKAKILTLPDTPSCRRAAQLMEGSGLGSNVYGIESDPQKITRIRADIRKKLETGSPISYGTMLVKAIAFAASVYTFYDAYEDYRGNQERKTNKIGRINVLRSEVDNARARIHEIDGDLRAINRVISELPENQGPNDTMSLGQAAAIGANTSRMTVQRAKDGGATTANDVKKSAQAEKALLEHEISNKQQEADSLSNELNCPDGNCGTPCLDDGCEQAAYNEVFKPARQAIQQCEMSAVVQNAPNLIGLAPTILDSEIPQCSVIPIDDPCFSLSPDGCGGPTKAERDAHRRREKAVNLASSMHCEFDDVACKQTVSAIHLMSAGIKPTGFVHSTICQSFDTFKVLRIETDPNIQNGGRPLENCGDFMGARKCDLEKVCHSSAKIELDRLRPMTSSLEGLQFYTFLDRNSQCSKFEAELQIFWNLYSAHLRDIRLIEQSFSALEPGALTVPLEGYGVLSLTEKPTPLLKTMNEQFGEFTKPSISIGSEKYYRENFCD